MDKHTNPPQQKGQNPDSSREASQEENRGLPKEWNEQSQVVNEQDQNRAVNTGDQDYKENVTGRTPEDTPRDLNLSGTYDKNASDDSEGGAEIETPHKKEADDEESTERKLPKM